MNERTRITRPPDSRGDKRTHRRHSSWRKRKSDELGSVDLSELGGFEYNSQELERAATSPLKISLDCLHDASFDATSSWQQTLQQEMSRKDEESRVEAPMHRSTEAGVIFSKEMDAPSSKQDQHSIRSAIQREMSRKDEEIDFEAPTHRLTEARSIYSTARKEIDTPLSKQDDLTMHWIRSTGMSPSTPDTPLFRHFRHQSTSSHESESPCSVATLTRGCGACFWERSLAWSEDDEDDEDDIIVHPIHNHEGTAIREHLSVPKHLGKDFAETQEARRCRSTMMPIRRPSSSRITTVESDSRHKLHGAKMFRQTDLDQVTEIHWEEKVLDTTALEMMAKLSL